MNALHRFFQDKELHDGVKAFLLEHLKQVAVNKAFAGSDTNGIKEAKLAIDNAFNQLEKDFGEKKKIEVNSSE